MQYPERFSNLPAYAFPRLRALLDPFPAGGEVLPMSIGEPKHPLPEFVASVLAEHTSEFGQYPPNDGAPGLLEAIAGWLNKRYDQQLDARDNIITLNGTREGLFNAALALFPERKNGRVPKVLLPNPFYQVYAIGALAAGAKPIFVPALASNGYMPDFAGLPRQILQDTVALYICSPSNPQGAVASAIYLAGIIELAEKFDFRIFADECYSEIYRTMPPTGALQVVSKISANPERVTVFHSLSKRSNLPGLRSGFAAGGTKTIKALKQLRSYAGAPLPLPLQRVAEKAWSDEEHVIASRGLYNDKHLLADSIFANIEGYTPPQGGFFLWMPVSNDEDATVKLWRQSGIKVLPGSYLSRKTDGSDPGENYIRVAMVAPIEKVKHGLETIRACLY